MKYVVCPDCGKKRPLARSRGLRCQSCAGKLRKGRAMFEHSRWKGGIRKNRDGYIHVRLPKDSPYYCMTNVKDEVLEHRLLMAQHLGQVLKPTDIVHHINGTRSDNRLENLHLLDPSQHKTTYAAGYTQGYADAVRDIGV